MTPEGLVPMAQLTFSADCRLCATVDVGSGPIADVAVADLSGGRIAIELGGLETAIELVGSAEAVFGLVSEAYRLLVARDRR